MKMLTSYMLTYWDLWFKLRYWCRFSYTLTVPFNVVHLIKNKCKMIVSNKTSIYCLSYPYNRIFFGKLWIVQKRSVTGKPAWSMSRFGIFWGDFFLLRARKSQHLFYAPSSAAAGKRKVFCFLFLLQEIKKNLLDRIFPMSTNLLMTQNNVCLYAERLPLCRAGNGFFFEQHYIAYNVIYQYLIPSLR